MKRLICLLVLATSTLLIPSCGKDAEMDYTTPRPNFKYDIAELYGIWETTEVYKSTDNEWATTSGDNSMYYFKVRFHKDNSYILNGAAYNEAGVFDLSGTIIETYVDKKLTAEYNISALEGGAMEVTKVFGTMTVRYKMQRIYHDSNI